MAAGEAIGCFGLTEPDAGSDPGSMRTRARRDGDDWILHGQKMWITNGSVADVAVVWARDRRGRPRLPRPARAPRASPPRTSTRSSRCAPRSPPSCCSTTCACPPTRCCPRRPRCAARSPASTRRATGSSGARPAPPAPASRRRWTTPRSGSQFGQPIAAFQIQQQKLAQMALEVNRATLLALHLGRMKDAGPLRPEHVSDGQARQRQRRARRRPHRPPGARRQRRSRSSTR